MTAHNGTHLHVRRLEDAIEAIAMAAKQGDSFDVVAAISHARAVRDVERCRRRLPRYGTSELHLQPTIKRHRRGDQHL